VDRCFIPNTKITLKNGYKNIDKIEIGDKVLTHTGDYQNVYELLKNPYKYLFFILKSFCGG
jgi:hypothetical protein